MGSVSRECLVVNRHYFFEFAFKVFTFEVVPVLAVLNDFFSSKVLCFYDLGFLKGHSSLASRAYRLGVWHTMRQFLFQVFNILTKFSQVQECRHKSHDAPPYQRHDFEIRQFSKVHINSFLVGVGRSSSVSALGGQLKTRLPHMILVSNCLDRRSWGHYEIWN